MDKLMSEAIPSRVIASELGSLDKFGMTRKPSRDQL
jgi:hypothetical protein